MQPHTNKHASVEWPALWDNPTAHLQAPTSANAHTRAEARMGRGSAGGESRDYTLCCAAARFGVAQTAVGERSTGNAG